MSVVLIPCPLVKRKGSSLSFPRLPDRIAGNRHHILRRDHHDRKVLLPGIDAGKPHPMQIIPFIAHHAEFVPSAPGVLPDQRPGLLLRPLLFPLFTFPAAHWPSANRPWAAESARSPPHPSAAIPGSSPPAPRHGTRNPDGRRAASCP